jgi:H/ACA ribonucleoprotein complex subunit 1
MGGRGGGRGFRDEGPPDSVVEIGKVLHECESELVCKLSQTDTKIPYFNAGIYLENKKKIGKVDEIFGPINLVMFTIKMDPGIVAKSFQGEDLVYISPDKLLPLSRFTGSGGGGGGRGRGGGRGDGRGGGRGGRSPGGRGFGGRSPGRGFGGRGGGRGRGRF